jgi:hypothetical protein
MYEGLDPDDAARALDEIDQRTEQVIEHSLTPWWFWWAVAGLMVELSAAVESREPVVIGVGTAVFVLGVLVVTGWVVVGTLRHAKPRTDLLGLAGVLAILGFVAVVVATTLPTAFLLEASGVRYPATLSMILSGALLVVGGPVLMRLLRQIMLASRAGGQR